MQTPLTLDWKAAMQTHDIMNRQRLQVKVQCDQCGEFPSYCKVDIQEKQRTSYWHHNVQKIHDMSNANDIEIWFRGVNTRAPVA